MQLDFLERKYIDKLLVVGHEYSDLEKTSALINKAGVEYANVSKNEKLEAREINEMILKSKKVKSDEVIVNQLTVSKVWDTLALDLFLSNIDKELWFWEDSTAINLLDYWKSLDEQLSFVLVYTDPENTISNFMKSRENFRPDELDRLLKNWLAYNTVLLDFFYKNKDRAFLVNTKQVAKDNLECVEQLTQKIGLPVDSKVISNILSTQDIDNISSDESNDLLEFMGRNLLLEYPQVIELYEELQSVANIYDMKNTYSKVNHKDMFCELVSIQKGNHDLRIEQSKLESQRNLIADKAEEKQQENELLLEQLHQVQEELEKYYLENRALKEKKEEKQRYYGAAQRVKDQLSYRLGAKMLESKSFFALLGLPFSLIGVVSQYRKNMKTRKDKKLPPIKTYTDAYEAQKVKGYLSYMLGQSMIKTMKNPLGIFILPFKLSATYKTFKKSKS